MTYVITEPCIDVKDQSCVEVCPVDCIHADGDDDRILYIHPDECIDCGACVPECPVEAIFDENELPEKWADFTALNAKLCEDWPVISDKQDPMPESEKWREVEAKRDQLSEAAKA